MSWTYDYEGQSTDLLDHCTAVTIDDESGAGKQGSNLQVGHLDGERWGAKPYAPLDVVLKTVLRYSNSSGAVTHADGAAGHVYENLSELKKLLGASGIKTLTRIAPDYGTVRARFEMISGPIRGEQRHVFYWPLRIPSGSWEDNSQSSATGNPPSVTTGGDRRIWDPEIEFSGAGSFTYTNGDSEVFKITLASGPTFPVTVAVVDGEWVSTDNASADAAQHTTIENPSVMVFDADSSLSIATTVSCTVRWRNRWA